ncbi:hypothetical protein BDV95DRAFT_594789 [Massariosphaeria phaeospora]|uniref:Uncharacterized protein n=1 Tax=Massariosphaeria phaeospora TaxID=100035 RepID=A0A7C8MKS6_9PLEO|nr:hypothetical protein BDV95DRAFT_594789 [Massariosphaeria phaeospora]
MCGFDRSANGFPIRLFVFLQQQCAHGNIIPHSFHQRCQPTGELYAAVYIRISVRPAAQQAPAGALIGNLRNQSPPCTYPSLTSQYQGGPLSERIVHSARLDAQSIEAPSFACSLMSLASKIVSTSRTRLSAPPAYESCFTSLYKSLPGRGNLALPSRTHHPTGIEITVRQPVDLCSKEVLYPPLVSSYRRFDRESMTVDHSLPFTESRDGTAFIQGSPALIARTSASPNP